MSATDLFSRVAIPAEAAAAQGKRGPAPPRAREEFRPSGRFASAVLDEEAMAAFLAEKLCFVCGFRAAFGFGVSVKRGMRGRWYCGDHRAEGLR